MPRHLLDDPELVPLVDNLVLLVLSEGSVNAAHRRLTSVLAEDRAEGWLYPNRLHALLSADRSRAINSETLDVLRRAFGRLPAELINGDAARERSAEQRRLVMGAWEAASSNADAGNGRLQATIEATGLPPAIVLWLLKDTGVAATAADLPASIAPEQQSGTPDWSFQDAAHRRSLEALRRNPNRKVGLVLPTGGGKTRVAMRIALSVLEEAERDDTVLLWVTHRTRLKTQARRELQRAKTEGVPGLPDDAARLLAERVKFCMIAQLDERLAEFKDQIELVIVDEAHHAAAPSYDSIFAQRPLRGLFLTATPNRTDLLPIGIDEVAYTITTRELFERGVIVEPKLETLTLDGFDWDDGDDRRDLAERLLLRAQRDFVKTLVAVSRVEYAELLHEALIEVLDEYDEHVLTPDDVAFVHGGGSSTGDPPEVFLDEFTARPRGILVATGQLLGEGFDEPTINAAVVTYPTQSMVQLMQVAGRCMRWAPGKRSAHVVQVRDSALAYHWEQRWLYQDISDLLRPQLVDLDYSSLGDLAGQIDEVLRTYNVPAKVAPSVRNARATVNEGERVSLLLTGLPYSGDPARFADDAGWSAVLVGEDDRDVFLRLFNDFSGRAADIADTATFLRNYIAFDPAPTGRWKRYMDMLAAMSFADREIHGREYDGAQSRGFNAATGTTWLRYFTFNHRPLLPEQLQEFLADAVNREVIVSAYVGDRSRWSAAIKLPLPLAGTLAFLLDDEQSVWVHAQRDQLRRDLAELAPEQSFAAVTHWRTQLERSPIPLVLIEHFDRFLREEAFAALSIALTGEPSGKEQA